MIWLASVLAVEWKSSNVLGSLGQAPSVHSLHGWSHANMKGASVQETAPHNPVLPASSFNMLFLTTQKEIQTIVMKMWCIVWCPLLLQLLIVNQWINHCHTVMQSMAVHFVFEEKLSWHLPGEWEQSDTFWQGLFWLYSPESTVLDLSVLWGRPAGPIQSPFLPFLSPLPSQKPSSDSASARTVDRHLQRLHLQVSLVCTHEWGCVMNTNVYHV